MTQDHWLPGFNYNVEEWDAKPALRDAGDLPQACVCARRLQDRGRGEALGPVHDPQPHPRGEAASGGELVGCGAPRSVRTTPRRARSAAPGTRHPRRSSATDARPRASAPCRRARQRRLRLARGSSVSPRLEGSPEDGCCTHFAENYDSACRELTRIRHYGAVAPAYFGTGALAEVPAGP